MLLQVNFQSAKRTTNRDASLACYVVEFLFDIHAHGVRTLIQDSKLRFVIKQSCHSESLLFAQTEDISPSTDGREPAFACHQMLKPNTFHDRRELVRDRRVGEIWDLWVGDLLPKRTDRVVRLLRNKEDRTHVGLVAFDPRCRPKWAAKPPTAHRPQPSKNPKDGRFARDIRPRDQQVLVSGHSAREASNEASAARCDHVHRLEVDVLRRNHSGPSQVAFSIFNSFERSIGIQDTLGIPAGHTTLDTHTRA